MLFRPQSFQGATSNEKTLKLKRHLTLALQPSIVKRGLKYSVIVGTILVLINQGDSFFSGELTTFQIWQILLTYTVPYVVSSLSSVQALVNQQKKSENPNG